jgi:hypothetical protein
MCVVTACCLALTACLASVADEALVMGNAASRADRLIPIVGVRSEPLVAEFSVDEGSTWKTATMYGGASSDERRGCSLADWNAGVLEGIVPAGAQTCLWNYHFDLELPRASALLKLASQQSGAVIIEKRVDLRCEDEALLIDHRNAIALAGGALPGKWALTPSGIEGRAAPSIFLDLGRKNAAKGGDDFFADRVVDDTPLALRPRLTGWHRVYVGMEPYSSVRFWLSRDDARYEVPNYYRDYPAKEQGASRRLCQEFLVTYGDLSGQDIMIAPGGSRFWRNAAVRYVRCVPMTQAEIDHVQHVRALAKSKGRPFAGYLEPCTPAHYEPKGTISLREHIRNEVCLNRVRGATDVYMHVIRLGCRAWYHSDLVEREAMSGWTEQGDAMAVGVEEAHAAGLKFFADLGMNSPYFKSRPDLTERFVREHPEYVVDGFGQNCFDYREAAIQDYVVSIVRELMVKYDVDGVNLDFARWGYRLAYDYDSLVAVLSRINDDRRAAEREKGHPIVLSARIDYDEPVSDDESQPVFVRALEAWAKAGHIDRIMVNGDDRVSVSTDFRHYVEAVSGSEVEFWLDLYWGTWPAADGGPAKDMAIARSWAEQGLKGGVYYYMRARPSEWEDINWQMRLIDFPDVVVRPVDW